MIERFLRGRLPAPETESRAYARPAVASAPTNLPRASVSAEEYVPTGSDGLGQEVRERRNLLDPLVPEAPTTLRAFNVAAHDRAAQRELRIGMGTNSLEASVLALPEAGQESRASLDAHCTDD